MEVIELLAVYLHKSSPITVFVLGWLSLYIIITLWISISRYFQLSSWIRNERSSLDTLLMGSFELRANSALYNCVKKSTSSERVLNICKLNAEHKATKGLSTLSAIAATAPFIGLFGTVVSILESFSTLGKKDGGASLNVIAPIISEALVATAAGIFVAIPAYSMHLLLKRKGYTLISYIQREIEFITSKSD
jgi:biopolymer transport protein ExbB/TolQ